MMMLENVFLHRLFGIENFHIYDAGNFLHTFVQNAYQATIFYFFQV